MGHAASFYSKMSYIKSLLWIDQLCIADVLLKFALDNEMNLILGMFTRTHTMDRNVCLLLWNGEFSNNSYLQHCIIDADFRGYKIRL